MGRYLKIVGFSIYLIVLSPSIFAQQIALDELFNDATNGWALRKSNSAEVSIEQGKLIVKSKSDRGFSSQIDHYFRPSQDFSIVASLRLIDGEAPIGISWGAQGNVSLFGATIFPDSSFRFFQKAYGEEYEIARIEELPLGSFETGGQVLLMIDKRDGIISFELNGYDVLSTQFIPFSGTQLGVIVDGRGQLEVDYLKVYHESNPINLGGDFSGYEKENLGPNINSIFAENGVIISPDGLEMYVVRNGHPGNMGQMKKDDIWYSTLDAAGWSKLKRLGAPLNNRGSNFVISVAPDGNNLLVANSYRSDGSPGGPGLSMSRKGATGWNVPKSVTIKGFRNQSQFIDFCLSPDGQVLIMSVDDGTTQGGLDLFASFKDGDEWGEPFSLGNDINSFANDFTPFVAADNQSLYFSSFGHPGYGSADIFVSRRLDASWQLWSEPENLGPDINTKSWDANLSIPAKGDFAYLTSNENSIGNIDIFKIELNDAIKPKPVILVKGRVINSMSGEGMEANINYYDLLNGEFLGEASSNPSDGSYQIVLPAGESYSFLADKSSFYSVSENVDALGIDSYQVIDRDLYLGPVVEGSTVRLNNIFFESSKYNLKPESSHELNRLILLLNDYPKMKIELAGHTDNEGQNAYNLNLSEQRAKEVYDYLLPYFSADRLQYKGYGESKPVADNATMEGRRLNRRVEFTIISLGEH